MRIFVYEHLCASGIPDAEQSSLRTEGWAMLAAVLDDFARLPGVEARTLLTAPPAGTPAWTWQLIRPGAAEAAFHAEARAADFMLVIAPEFDDILETRCRWVEEAGGRLLGPSSAAVALTGDKLALGQHLRAHGAPTPECRLLQAAEPWSIFPAVVKPRHGAGSQDTFLVHRPEQLAVAEHHNDMLVQPFVPGQAASVSFLIGAGHHVPLTPAEQHLSTDGRFHYLGGRVPLAPEQAERAIRVAERAVRVVPGLNGYVGVDVVLGPPADGSADQVIEINPRLTTSYVGLRALARDNLAAALLRVVQGDTPQVHWRAGVVCFGADGSLT